MAERRVAGVPPFFEQLILGVCCYRWLQMAEVWLLSVVKVLASKNNVATLILHLFSRLDV